jgi:hypothetical protein
MAKAGVGREEALSQFHYAFFNVWQPVDRPVEFLCERCVEWHVC